MSSRKPTKKPSGPPAAVAPSPRPEAAADALDLLRRFAGGETPAERIARVEKEHRNPDVRILDRLTKKKKKR
jgi:hypothetical protein